MAQHPKHRQSRQHHVAEPAPPAGLIGQIDRDTLERVMVSEQYHRAPR